MSEALYRQRHAERSTALAREERTLDMIGNVRIALAGVALVLVVLPIATRHSGPWWGLIPLAIGFLGLGGWHDRVSVRARRLAGGAAYYRRELDRVDEKWRELPDDGADLSPATAEAQDLDLFGPASLFQLANRALTDHGRRTLASWLGRAASVEEIGRRHEAVRELRDAVDFREALAAAATGAKETRLADKALLEWAEKTEPMRWTGLLSAIAVVLPIAYLTAFGVAIARGDAALGLLVVLIQLGVRVGIAALTKGDEHQRAEALSGPDRTLTRYADLIEQIEGATFAAPLLRQVQERLRSEGAPAAERIRKLRTLVDMHDWGHNLIFALTFGLTLLWDLNIVLRAEKWRRTTGTRLRAWLEAIGEMEALASFGAMSAERPGWALPAFAAEPAVYRATGLEHPLIDRRKVVANDITLNGAGSVVILSGSNMSGKSTHLRAIGVSVVMAQAGAPVPAASLELSAVVLATSIRVSDSLARGASHFYAELERIKTVVTLAGEHGPRMLYLLDEMLHGTNSKERYIGAVSVIRWLSERGAFGVVTTHDLSLARVEEALPPGTVRNMHFGDEVIEGKIVFDYKLKPGPVRSTNALRLMKAIGIDIELTAPPEA